MASMGVDSNVPFAIQVAVAEASTTIDCVPVAVAAPPRPSAQWGVPLLGCCASCVPNCLVVALCPCIAMAQVETRLGGSFESSIMVFGLLVTALLLSAGLLVSSALETDAESESGDGSPSKPSVPIPTSATVAAVAALLLVAATARQRTRTRGHSDLRGSAALDAAVTLACCPCVLAQMATQLGTYTPGVCSLAPPPSWQLERDELPGYAAST